ncbi:hypothetical protein [Chitinophaga sancti]|uniref:Uncharacterized protein n=1 Tax=Chitinophaga sancti TaxID=1004 RepID=A0ABZ0X7X6_9BACT|nr:hypothetical protein [Chitinophaga sancti]WQD61171.1 hypothetical protein U0033_25135 [Chitinophaga sancti]WQG86702.1 hypothetical protein SR876_17330 [Chitinophaga sancti]
MAKIGEFIYIDFGYGITTGSAALRSGSGCGLLLPELNAGELTTYVDSVCFAVV